MSDSNNSRSRSIFKLVRRLLSLTLPFVIVVIILLNVDLAELKRVLRYTNVYLLVSGVLFQLAITQIVIIRWRQTILAATSLKMPITYLTKQFYIAFSLGHFVPSAIGLDIYRVAVVGKKSGKYFQNILAILIEKFSGLISVSSLIVLLYPIINIYFVSSDKLLDRIFHTGIILLMISMSSLLLLMLIRQQRMIEILFKYMESFVNGLISKITTHINFNNKLTIPRLSLESLLELLKNRKTAVKIVLLSFAIQFALASKSFIFFKALGYDLPFLIILFVVPVLYFIFFLPVSFGGLGVREGTFIVMYGLFGVPAEIALTISFFNLLSAFTITAIGALMLMLNKRN